jgi:hypothetical protein
LSVNSTSGSLVDLPFDQYARHQLVRIVAERVRDERGQRLRVLDVGGSPCLTPRFIPDEWVAVIDVADPGAGASHHQGGGGFLRADGRALPFLDDAFDLVVSLDSLEHVEPAGRESYVRELVRVARGYALLMAPRLSQETVLAERLLSAFVAVVNQEEQPQLAEHEAYGLPDFEAWHGFVRDLGLSSVAFSSGFLYSWLPMMLLKHYVSSLVESAELHGAIDHFYNVALQQIDRRLPGYRGGLVICKTGNPATLDALAAELAPSGEVDRIETLEHLERIGLLLKIADLHVASRRDDRLREQILDKERHILNLEIELREARRARGAAEDEAAGLRQRVAHLSEHLEGLKAGRVMRALAALESLKGRGTK